MIQSMTGYGKAEIILEKSHFTIEVKSLNSKQIDTNIKMISSYRGKEIELRKLLSKKLHRGKIELSIWRQNMVSSTNLSLNIEVLKDYHNQILQLKNDLGLNKQSYFKMRGFEADILPALLKMPDVFEKEKEIANKDEWHNISQAIDTAISNLLQYRIVEGEKLELDIKSRIDKIAIFLKRIIPLSEKRIEKVKNNLTKKLSEIESKSIDQNRFEQELIYYLEKQDITEEQVRLDAHLTYFITSMDSTTPNGKKLGFISQEIGREINTIGSKSSDIEMQKIVVQMKDELEKIKEQLLNIL